MRINNKKKRESTLRKKKIDTRIGIHLVLLLLLVWATACGSGSEQAGQNGRTEAGRQTEQGSQSVQSSGSSTASGASAQQTKGTDGASGSEKTGSPGQPRSYKHDFGTIEVPASPERIVGIYLDDFLLALGVKPRTQTMYGKRNLPYLQDRIGDLPAINPSGINLELILEEKPDLILLAYPVYAEEGKYELFSKIAPTYVFTGEEGWRQTLRTMGDVIGKPKQAENWLNEYDRKVAAARESLKKAIGDETVMFIRFTRAERIQIYGGPSNFAADVLYQDLGLKPSELVKKVAWGEDNSAPLISAELIAQFDADHIFITYDNPANEDAKAFKNHPLWKNIPAVKKGNLHEVEMFHWMNEGPIANSTKVDDVLKALLK